jgi:type II secretory pathway pseudopilin PulG
MTLIELIVVIAIAAGLLGASLYSINMLTAADLRDESMRLTSAIKHTWTQAALKNTQYRLILNLEKGTYHTEIAKLPARTTRSKPDDGGDGDAEQSSSFGSSDPSEAMDTQQGGKVALPPPTEITSEDDLENEEETDPFGVDKAVEYREVKKSIIEETTLKEGISFKQVKTPGIEKPQRKGKVSLRFYPDGFMEPAVIVLENKRKEHFSVVTEPLTGRVKLFSRIYETPDDFGEGTESDD